MQWMSRIFHLPKSRLHRHRSRRGGTCPPKIREKYFSDNYYVKFGHFKNFSYIFFGQKCCAPLKLTGLLRLWVYGCVDFVAQANACQRNTDSDELLRLSEYGSIYS